MATKKGHLQIDTIQLDIKTKAKDVKIEQPIPFLKSDNVEDALNKIGQGLKDTIGEVPDNLNTLKKIASAINNDPNFYINIKSLVSGSGSKLYSIEEGYEFNDIDFNLGDFLEIINTHTNTSKIYICVNATADTFDKKFRQLITEDFYTNLITNLVGNAPDTLNTLGELANAINNDPNFSININKTLDKKVSLEDIDKIKNEITNSSFVYHELYKKDDYNRFNITNGCYIFIYGYDKLNFYKCTNSNATTFATKYTLVTDQSEKQECINSIFYSIYCNNQDEAVSLDIASDEYVMLGTRDLHEVYICKNSDGTTFDDIFVTLDNIVMIKELIDTKIAELIDSAPDTLNTLKEISEALGNDPNFSTTIINQLSLKSPIASPAFTGTPTAITPSADDNSTRLATTAFVKNITDGKSNNGHTHDDRYYTESEINTKLDTINSAIAQKSSIYINSTLPDVSARDPKTIYFKILN